MFERARHLSSVASLAVLVFCLLATPVLAGQILQVAAAADLQPVLPALLASWKAQTGNGANVSYASSATLTTEIENGAPFDLFLSADMSFPEKLTRDGLADSKPTPYARGTLVLWARRATPLPPLSPELLRNPAVHSIAIANPEHAPYGRAAVAALKSLGMFDAVETKLRTAENIAQAAEFVESGNAQVGLLSLTSALSPRLLNEGRYVELPTGSYPPIVQGAVVIQHAKNATTARALLKFLLSSPMQQQFEARGLRPPL